MSKSFLLGLWVLLAVVMLIPSEALANQENSKNVYNGSTPMDLQRAQAEHEITRLRSELSNAEQTSAISSRIYIVGAMLALVFFGAIGFVFRQLNRQIEDESTELKQRYDRHIDPNAEANRQAAVANTENTRLLGYRNTFQTRELGTSPVGQGGTGQFAAPPGFRIVPE